MDINPADGSGASSALRQYKPINSIITATVTVIAVTAVTVSVLRDPAYGLEDDVMDAYRNNGNLAECGT
ncbi:hypothetical protein BG015_002255 [Linnemannia schmuckeri]|uniref:Uncharacterized protein n=1 Tax=Linnemannia schmuckeri TaxID=64567 RepID=A0A9P5VD73_9FUNG|nr:hypothetical protein BG015_002255 [Linnemannia schmuckeri]